ncbi:MAG: DUF3786 domain-containing protein [Aigarchaeota archaeon]|nr:DUF3786 domain-containing protein [Aigarchaeota archaeon]MCX8193465.1 DUF3786 domain-containing protein [Nitrososphaeria archaeon]MDW7985803.1 DUF3786 domain-containing protein [Nitrososphaerota archaeon]
MSIKNIYSPSLDEEILTAFNNLAKCEGEEIGKKCNVVYLKGGAKKGYRRFIVNFLNKTYSVEVDNREVVDLISGKPPSKELVLVILRYLAYSTPGRTSESWVPFEKLPDSRKYLEMFRKVVVRPILRTFGSSPEKYELACKRIGGRREKLGGISYSFYLLPKVQLLTQLWKAGKEDYSHPAANVSFNYSVRYYLNARDLLLAAKLLVDALEAESKKL